MRTEVRGKPPGRAGADRLWGLGGRAEHIGTKTAVQIRSHAQKFFSKLEKEQAAGAKPDGPPHPLGPRQAGPQSSPSAFCSRQGMRLVGVGLVPKRCPAQLIVRAGVSCCEVSWFGNRK